MTKFVKDLEKGKIAEVLLFNILSHSKDIACIFDKSDDEQARLLDYDFFYRTYSNILEGVRAEVKYDGRIASTNNIFAEYSSKMKKDSTLKDGWLKYTKSNYIYYYDALNKVFFVFKTIDLLEYIDKNKKRLKTGIAYDENKIMKGYLVPINKFAAQCPVYILTSEGEWV